ncbi:heavy-metal-associated domain-containing protein [Bordetella petrii]|uniref:heavy-metal-associated domain-containing protein n=1 Tax=Bordetella petrii TaxID=94624 RepID=UPI001E44858D|nr:heavy-metal-associated domain-containing protein [Bordetella petrii]MCD0506019.1 heavy-metal-associated domain-containing protein [Bordetella petrii]
MSIQFSVPDMTCGHCVSTITRAVHQAVPGAQVTVDLARHLVTVQGAAQAEAVQAAIVQAGYEPRAVA